MSYTEMYKVNSDGTVHHAAEFRNSFRGAFLVWKQMGERYLGIDAGKAIAYNESMQEVWNLWKSPDVPLHHRIVMMSTFDHVMVRRENLPRLIAAIEKYALSFDPGTLLQQAHKLQELAQDESVLAVCWNQTSVNCGVWWVYDGSNDEDEGQPYNINRDSDHYFLFDEINEAP